MKVKDLLEYLKGIDPEREFLVSSDEELSSIFGKWEVCELGDMPGKPLCIFGYSGTEIEDDNRDEEGS